MRFKVEHHLFEINEDIASFELPLLLSIPNESQHLTLYSQLCFNGILTRNLREHVMSKHDVCEDG